MNKRDYGCPKCLCTTYKTGELRTTGSGISRFLNIQNQKYATVACSECGYTELYRTDGGGIGNIIDLFSN